jgi:hypothetical protein
VDKLKGEFNGSTTFQQNLFYSSSEKYDQRSSCDREKTITNYYRAMGIGYVFPPVSPGRKPKSKP